MEGGVNLKFCPRCSETKPDSEFYNSSKTKDGLRWYCKECCKELKSNDPKYLERQKKYSYKYYHERGGKQKRKQWKENNNDKVRSYKRKWANNNKFKIKFNNLNRKGIIHNFSDIELWDKLKSTNGVCQICNRNVGYKQLTVDHIIPISKVPIGTIYTIDDIQYICQSCNSSKSNKIIMDYEIIDI